MNFKADEAYEFQVNNYLISAGQPTEKRLKEILTEKAVIISLRGEKEDPFEEDLIVQNANGEFYRLATDPFSFATEEYREKLFKLLDQHISKKKKIYLHCGSANRTGAAWAVYQKVHLGMDSNEALEEGIKAGLLGLKPKIKELFESF